MLRPATPLTILLLIAFVLLLISVISTPIVKAIPLATFQGVDFGVFGCCKGTQCSGFKVGYTTDQCFLSNSQETQFSLSSSARHSLSSILIVHPVAAFLTLVCFLLAATAHLHSPSHSPRYLLALLILLLPTLLITLLAFLVDILLFVPHLQWGGWIVLASTILLVASGVVTCAMRRTLVSRKARKKRIAENAEMNGDNFYSREDTMKADSPPPLGLQPTAPIIHTTAGADKLPAFATYEAKRMPSDEERIPLNSRSPTTTAVTSSVGEGVINSVDGTERYGGPGRGGPGGMRGGRGGRGYNGPRDEFGNPLPLSAAFGPGPNEGFGQDSSERILRNQYSNETMNSQSSRGRGRGYGPRGGFYGPARGGPGNGRGYGRGGPPMNGGGRGMPGGVIAAGAGAGMVVGDTMGRGPQDPPPGYGNGPGPQGRRSSEQQSFNAPSTPHDGPGQGYGRQPSPGPPSAPGYARRPSAGSYSAPGYARRASPGPPSNPGLNRRPSPGPPSAPGMYAYGGRQASPGPLQRQAPDSFAPPMPEVPSADTHGIGQAVEMDAFTGHSSPAIAPGIGPMGQLRDSDSDVQGLVGLQQRRGTSPLQQDSSGPISPSSQYNNEESYIPPRAGWVDGISRNGTPPISTSHNPILTRTDPSPIELPTRIAYSPTPPIEPTFHARVNSADNYYEDVDPRFAEPISTSQSSQPPLPTSLMPGQIPSRRNSPSYLDPSSSYENIADGGGSGSRSPAASDASQFTSVSQRGINPNWRPPPSNYQGMGGAPSRRPMGQQRDVLLGGNPDFEIPGVGGRGPGQRAPMNMGQVPQSRYPEAL